MFTEEKQSFFHVSRFSVSRCNFHPSVWLPNIGNATRQRTASLLLSKKHSAGFSKPEIGALEQVVRGTKTANATRHIGNLLGGGGGFGQGMMSAAGAVPGMLMGSPALGVAGAIAAPVGGAASKVWSNYLTKKALEASDAATRKRSPLHETMQANTPLAVMSPEKRASLVRAMMMGSIQDGSPVAPQSTSNSLRR